MVLKVMESFILFITVIILSKDQDQVVLKREAQKSDEVLL